jgi:hypothetical protein
MKKTILMITFFGALTLGACKKNNDQLTENKPRNDSYQPLTAGSAWTYKNTINVGSGLIGHDSYEASAETKKIGDKTYIVLKAGNGKETYFQQAGNKYSTLVNLAGNDLLPLEYLDVSATAGTTWTNSVGLYQLKTTIVEKNLTKVILGKSYNDVIHTTVEYQEKDGANFKTQLFMDFYAAKGVGIIQTGVSNLQFEISRSELTDYAIK